MERQTLYCELDFLVRLIEDKPAPSPAGDLEEPVELTNWKNYVGLFLHNSKICMETKREKLHELIRTNKFFSVLLKQFQSAEIDLSFCRLDEIDARPSGFFNEIDPHALFFLDSAERCRKLSEAHGMIFVSNELRDDLAECIFGYEADFVSVGKRENKLRDWDFISRYKHPCNSLIISDNYILADSRRIRNNLLELVDKLLPEKLERDFQLVILTGNAGERIDVENRYRYLVEQVGKLREYPIELKIVARSVDNHDRNILTNYLWISSGYGFSIFKGRQPGANTHISIHPIASRRSIREVVESLKRQYKKIEQEADNVGSGIVVMPKEKTRQVSSRLLKNLLP